MSILAEATAGVAGTFGMIAWLVILFVIMYFLMIRPQKKEQKRKELMLNDVAAGDTVLTTSGFYGTIIDNNIVKIFCISLYRFYSVYYI